MSIKGTETEKNILKAFAGESQARNRYTYFASQAKKDGYVQISNVFTETANQEKEHAKRLFKLLEGGMLEITDSYPAGVIGTTAENLKGSAGGEHHEHTEMYPGFAEIADREGFKAIAAIFRNIAVAEKQHEKRFLGLLKNLDQGTTFSKNETVVWFCQNCGYVHTGKEAPAKCPACDHPQAHFMLVSENW